MAKNCKLTQCQVNSHLDLLEGCDDKYHSEVLKEEVSQLEFQLQELKIDNIYAKADTEPMFLDYFGQTDD